MTGLLEALGIGRGDVVAVAGAGGKTTLVYALARQARGQGLRVLVTTTTHMGVLPEETTGPVFVEAEGRPDAELAEALVGEGWATLLGRRVRPDKLEGIPPERVDSLAPLADLVLVEADGARGRSLKVPAPHEPVIPGSATLLVVMAALDVLGRPLDDRHVHRLERICEAGGWLPGTVVDEDVLAAALLHPAGYLSRFASGRRSAVFLNKAEESPPAAAERLARRLLTAYDLVAAGSARQGTARAWPWP